MRRNQNGSNVNVIYVRVKNYEGSDRVFSIVINRWHDNVNTTYDWFQQQLDEANPLHAGLYDLNRYCPLALER